MHTTRASLQLQEVSDKIQNLNAVCAVFYTVWSFQYKYNNLHWNCDIRTVLTLLTLALLYYHTDVTR